MAKKLSAKELEQLAKQNNQEYKFFEVVNGLENKYLEQGRYYSYWILQDGTILECIDCHCSVEEWIASNFIVNGYEVEDVEDARNKLEILTDDFYDSSLGEWTTDDGDYINVLERDSYFWSIFNDETVEGEYYAARCWGAIRITIRENYYPSFYLQVPSDFKMSLSQLSSCKKLLTTFVDEHETSSGKTIVDPARITLSSLFNTHCKVFVDFSDSDTLVNNVMNNLTYFNNNDQFRNESVTEQLQLEELLLDEAYFIEKTRGELVAKSKRSDDYKGDKSKGRNRWFRGQKLKPVESKDNYNKIDMDSLWKKDILDVDIYVYGETDIYTVKVKIRDVIKELAKEVEANHQKYEYKCIYRALQRAIENDKVWVSCNCLDWRYRQAFVSTQQDYNSGEPENRPANITNPHDTKGAGCKHVNCLLSNIGWLLNIASVINNYIHYMKKVKPQLFADYIFPKIFGMKYERAVQLDLFDDQELKSDSEIISLANEYNRRRTQFKTASEYATADTETNLGTEEPKEISDETPEPTHESLSLQDTYIGKSMSVRAKQAYDNGEQPISKWTKQEILDNIEELFPNLTDEQINTLQRMSVQDLKNKFLKKSSWHHTGKYYNQTNFYSIDVGAVDEFFTPKQEIEVDLTTIPYYEFVIYVDSPLSRLGSKVVYDQTTHDKWNLNKSYNEIKNEAVEQLKHFNEIYKNATLFIYDNNHKLIDEIKGDLI